MYFTFTGHIEGNQETLPTLRGHPTAKGYGWGSSCKCSMRFEITGEEKNKQKKEKEKES